MANHLILRLFPLLAVILLLGCEPAVVINGRVCDTHGTGLPGAAVTVLDSTIQAPTDARGYYKLSCPKSYLGSRDDITLSVIKSGYGSTRIKVSVPDSPITMSAPEAVLWSMPSSEGVFVLDNRHYLKTTYANVRRYITEETGPRYGTKKTAKLQINKIEPQIFSYRMYGFDIQLARLEEVLATELEDGEQSSPEEGEIEYNETIWVLAENVAISAAPVDEPERFLYEIKPRQPLEPGHYAIHWGALNGFLNTEARIFLFDIVEEDELAEANESEGTEESGDR